MSEHKKQTEQQLWDVLTEPVVTEEPEPVKKIRRKSGPLFASEAPVKDVPAAPNRKPDGFFFACMAGVAAVSVAATLLISGMTGRGSGNGNTPDPAATGSPSVSTTAPLSGDSLQALEQENEQLQEDISQLGTLESIQKIAREVLDLVLPGTVFFGTGD